MGGGGGGRVEFVCVDVDAVLWVGEGVVGGGGLFESRVAGRCTIRTLRGVGRSHKTNKRRSDVGEKKLRLIERTNGERRICTN